MPDLNDKQDSTPFTQTLSTQMVEEIQKRYESLRTMLFGILGALSGIIAAVLATVGFLGSQAIDHRVSKTVEDALESQVGAAQFAARVAAVNFHALKLNLATGFTEEEAELIIADLDQLYSQRADSESRNELKFAFDTAVDSFALANRTDFVERLEDAAPDLFRHSDIVLQTMLQIQGRKLLTDEPRTWMDPNGAKAGIYKSYRTYSQRAEARGYPELYYLYEMLLRHLEGKPDKEIKNLIDDADSLNEMDSISFVKIMKALATDTATKESNAETRRIAERVSTFLCKFQGHGKIISIVLEVGSIECS